MDEERRNVRRCGQIGEGEDDILSIGDFLEEHDRLQADADAVLGGSDEYNCSYPKGYLDRQALYACATCSTDGPAAVCLACSYTCHEGHDLHELYTKRNFRCDCGNEKFGGQVCKLYANKTEPNTRNRYNHNFKGAYCTCLRPFPDPEDSTDDEMIQCIMCEDWFHGRHLKIPVPDTDFTEMICPMCMTRHSFLWAYQVSSEVLSLQKEENTEECSEKVDVDGAVKSCSPSPAKPEQSTSQDSDQVSLGCDKLLTSEEQKAKAHSELKETTSETSAKTSPETGQKRERAESPSKLDGCSSPKRVKHEDNSSEVKSEPGDVKTEAENTFEADKMGDKCQLVILRQRTVEEPEVAAFWHEGWRQKLCRCEKCMDMYKDKEIEYLLDESDTVQAYEARGKEKSSSNDETMTSALSGMNRVQQIEVVSGMMDLQSRLTEFLGSFAREGKVVTETDVREFFQRMHQRIRQRRQNGAGTPQPFCR